ncbi:MAG TPA: PilN domain-containing protein [Rhodocyclaceae bacterium]|nr:PilN domain-containing protein [Rhodocyclaceae bacterium]
MSQQINLLLAELRPRRDWLAFPIVAGVALMGLVILSGLAVLGRYQVQTLEAAQARSETEVKALQQQVQNLGQVLAGRRGNPALQSEIDRLRDLLQQQDAALAVVESGKTDSGGGHASLMRGFARQVTEGVWLTGFSFSGHDAEIRGRLADPALLPLYIRRLNAEEAFQGRRFSALDMKDGSAAKAPEGAPAARYTEFTLHGNLIAGEGKKP